MYKIIKKKKKLGKLQYVTIRTIKCYNKALYVTLLMQLLIIMQVHANYFIY